MIPEQACDRSRFARVICVGVLLALSTMVSAAGAQQSYRTQRSSQPAPASSQPSKQTTPSATKPPVPHAGRFLGWRMAAHDGPDAVRYFQNLEQQSKRLPGVHVSSRAGLHAADRSHTAQSETAAASVAPAALPGIMLRASLPAGALPSSVATGDFNGDGKLDWVISNSGESSLDLYLGKGDGTAQLPVIIQLLGQSPVAVVAADLNGDAKLDLVVAESDSGTIGILFGNGDGTFQPEVEISLPVPPLAVAIADLNGDHKPDLVVGINATQDHLNYFATLLNTGSGHFASPVYAPVPTPNEFVLADELSVADVNGDGIPDVLATGADPEGTVVQLFLGQGDGTFVPGERVDNSSGPVRDVTNAVLADVNGDGCADVVDVDTIATVHIFPGDCKGDFDNQTSFQIYGVGDVGVGLAVADVNSDGHLDIITGGIPGGPGGGYGTETGDTVTVRFGNGKGQFGAAQVYRGDPGMFTLAVADLHGNGHPDIITANQNANTTTVYVNNGSGNFGAPQGGYDGFEEGTPTSPTNAPKSRLVVADINGDGKPDLGLVEYGNGFGADGTVTVMLNQGSGQFSAPISSPAVSSNPALDVGDFVFADFRKTGQLDFLAEIFDATEASQPELVYAQNMGNGQFGAPVSIPFTTQTDYAFGALGVGDFNKDGKLDFAVVTSSGPAGNPDQLTVYLGHGDGTFTQSYQVSFGSQVAQASPWPEAVFVGDANGDGKQDIYVWLYYNVFGSGAPPGRDLFQFFGNGDGTFQAPKDVLQNLSAMTMADLNHDGRLDVVDIESASTVLAEGEPGTAPPQVNVYLGQANGSFGAATTYTPYGGTFDTFTGNNLIVSNSFQTYFGDFNGDGNLDVALFQTDSLSGGPSYVQFLVGNADGTFTPTYDVFNLGIQEAPDLTALNLLGDGRAAFLQTPNYTSSYQVLPATNAPAFQIQPAETPVLGGADSLAVALNLPSASDTVVTLSASDPGIQIAPSATIPAGQLSVEVPFTLGSGVIKNRWFSLTAKSGGETQIAYDFPGSAIDSFTQVIFPGNSTVQPGEFSEGWSAGVQSNGDASGTFQTSCQGLPAGIACQFQFGLQTFTVPGGGFQNVLFQIPTTSTTPTGKYKFNIVSTDGETVLTTPETLQVMAPPPPAPAVSFNPVGAVFQPAIVGSTQTQTVMLSNTGAGTLNISGITIPSGGSSFTQSNTCGASLAANSMCTITITLATKSTGSPTGSLAVADNAPGSPQTVALSASVGDMTLQPAAGAPTSITVKAGTPAVFSLQLTPTNYMGGVPLTCTGTISMGTCTIQPTPLSVDFGVAPEAFQVTVTSTAPIAGGSSPSGFPGNRLPLVIFLGLLLLAAAAAASNVARSAKGLVIARAGQVAALLLTGALLLASCGGGGGGGTGPTGPGIPGTPAGTYPFTITASAGGATRTLPITVVIQ